MGSSAAPAPLHVLLVADPGLPTRRATSIRAQLEATLTELLGRDAEVSARTEMIRIDPDNVLEYSDAHALAEEYENVDVILLLTEIPRHSESKPLMAEIFPEHRVGVLSCPTFGAWVTKRRMLRVLVDAVLRVAPGDRIPTPRRYTLRWSQWSRRDGSYALHAHTFTGAPRTVAGMTMANDPWRTAPKLSRALAAASATGAFGIFYHSIWQMSDALSTTRLLAIGLTAMTAMGAWLILSNGLWDRPKRESLSRVVLYYNLSTVLTLALCMFALYALLVVVILVGALIVIDPGFMSEILGKDARFSNYLDIAWLSAAMGTVAGALGSGFDSETDLRRITHGQRERQRRYTREEHHDDAASA
ncbi:MAG: hypothetical protein ACTHX1_13615 [Micrococcaceae bacterium]